MPEKEPRDVVLTLRIPKRIAERIEDLRPFIEEQPVFAMKSRLNRSDVIRYLLLEGLRKVETVSDDE